MQLNFQHKQKLPARTQNTSTCVSASGALVSFEISSSNSGASSFGGAQDLHLKKTKTKKGLVKKKMQQYSSYF